MNAHVQCGISIEEFAAFEQPAMRFVDSHCHIQLDPLYQDAENAIERAKRCGCAQIVVCGVSCNSDWRRVEYIYSQHPDFVVPQFGLHPWYIDIDSTGLSCWESDLRGILTRLPTAGVGEAGLDKNVRKRVCVDVQEDILLCHLAVAREFVRPLTIHCVGYWGRLADLLKQEERAVAEEQMSKQRSAINIVIHSCNNMPIEISREFLSLKESNVYFSFNGCRTLQSKQADMVRSLPQDRLLVESDSPDQKPTWAGCDELIAQSCGPALLDGEWTVGGVMPSDCNEPCFATSACLALSRALNIAPTEVAEVTLHNAVRAFSIG